MLLCISPSFYNKMCSLCNRIALEGQIETRPNFLREDFLEKIFFITGFLNVILGVQVIPVGLVKNGPSKVINYSVLNGKSAFTVCRYQSAAVC